MLAQLEPHRLDEYFAADLRVRELQPRLLQDSPGANFFAMLALQLGRFDPELGMHPQRLVVQCRVERGPRLRWLLQVREGDLQPPALRILADESKGLVTCLLF